MITAVIAVIGIVPANKEEVIVFWTRRRTIKGSQTTVGAAAKCNSKIMRLRALLRGAGSGRTNGPGAHNS
jgi:hypothetical protein